jgi:hypothetical protein
MNSNHKNCTCKECMYLRRMEISVEKIRQRENEIKEFEAFILTLGILGKQIEFYRQATSLLNERLEP